MGMIYQDLSSLNPSKSLNMGAAEDRQYYIDFSPVRGNKIIESLKRNNCHYFAQ
jgi:hypothetical protein